MTIGVLALQGDFSLHAAALARCGAAAVEVRKPEQLADVDALVRQGVRAGRYRRVRVTHAAAVILGLLDGVALQLTFDPDAFTVGDAARFCEEALRRYLAAGPGRGR